MCRFCVDISFQFIWVNAKDCMLGFSRNCLSSKDYFAFPPTINESCCSTSSPAFGVIVLHFSCLLSVLWYLILIQFPDEIWCWASFPMLICHLYIFFGEVPILPIFKLSFLTVEFWEFFVYLDTNSSLDICFVKIYSQSVAWITFCERCKICVQLCQHHLLKILSFLHWIPSSPLSKTSWLSGSISGLSIMFHWYICLFFHQYHAVLISVALW